MTNGWKITAIIFIVLFIAETLFVGWGMYLVEKETAMTNECYYEICADYPEAWYELDVCTCYDINQGTGEYEVAKEIWMK